MYIHICATIYNLLSDKKKKEVDSSTGEKGLAIKNMQWQNLLLSSGDVKMKNAEFVTMNETAYNCTMEFMPDSIIFS